MQFLWWRDGAVRRVGLHHNMGLQGVAEQQLRSVVSRLLHGDRPLAYKLLQVSSYSRKERYCTVPDETHIVDRTQRVTSSSGGALLHCGGRLRIQYYAACLLVHRKYPPQ